MKKIMIAVVCLVSTIVLADAKLPRDTVGPIEAMPAEYRSVPAQVIEAAAKVTAAKYPDADTVAVDAREHTRYEADGKCVDWEERWTKCVTERGKRSLGTVETYEMLRYGDSAIQVVEVLGEDGVIRPVDFRKTLKEATENSSMSANIYDPLDKTLSCAVPGLKIGDTVHTIIATRTLKPRMANFWCGVASMEGFSPILSKTVTVDAPNALPPAITLVRNPVGDKLKRAPDAKLSADRTLLKWTLSEMPQAFYEPRMPSLSREGQTLRITTAPDWATISKWYWNLCLPHMEKTNEAMTNKVAELTSGLKDDMAKINSIYRFVAQEIRYMGLTLEDASPGYAPHDVNITFDNRYGVCRDKAALLVEMLRIAGLDAYPTLIMVGTKIDMAVPMPYFNHAITAVAFGKGTKDEHYVLMDPTNESSKDLFPDYLMNRSYLVCRPEGDTLRESPVTDPRNNAAFVKTTGRLDENGTITAKTVIDFTGYADSMTRGRMLRMSPEERRDMVSAWVSGTIAGGEMLDCEIRPADLRDTSTAVSIEISSRFPDAVLKGETVNRLKIPYMGDVGIAQAILRGSTSLEKRRFSMVEPFTCMNSDEIEIELPASMREPKSLPETLSIGDGFTLERAFEVKDGTLHCVRRLYLSKVEFTPEQYITLREDLKAQEIADRTEPLFVADASDLANANIRTLLSDRAVILEDANNWVVTNRTVTEVLTYDGKKSNAEIRFDFNPLCDRIEIVSATVSNRNGTVARLTEKEINIMDANWVGAAPRYPASKIMMVTLPAVEVGSVIDVTTAHSVKGSAKPYEVLVGFDSTEPIVEKRLSVVAPADLKLSVRDFGEAKGDVTTAADGRRVYSWGVKNPKTLAKEANLPFAPLWRNAAIVAAGRMSTTYGDVDTAMAKARDAGNAETRKLAAELVRGVDSEIEKVRIIRDWIAKNIRTAGPRLFWAPTAAVLTNPDRIIEDGYASHPDVVNLTSAMLQALGMKPRIVFVNPDSGKSYKELATIKAAQMVGSYGTPVVRVAVRGADGKDTTLFLAGEDQYMPIAISLREGCEYYDVEKNAFGVVPRSGELDDVTNRKYVIRKNGMADLDFEDFTHGKGIGRLRKFYKEVTPEIRERHYRSLLGVISENATATSPLVTNVDDVPFSRSFSAAIPGFAESRDGMLTVKIPAMEEFIVPVNGEKRTNPILVGEHQSSQVTHTFVFPEGYSEIEHLPKSFKFTMPDGFSYSRQVSHKFDAGVLTVQVVERWNRSEAIEVTADYFRLFKEWNRIAGSDDACTIVVRRK